MDRKVFTLVKQTLERLGAFRRRPGQVYSDGRIVAVYYFAILNRRPLYWACDQDNWPRGYLRGALPSQSCLSRRLRQAAVRALLDRVEKAVRHPPPPLVLAAAIDGKTLQIAMHSADPHAGKGRGAGHLANGYKIHALIGSCGTLLSWRLAPLDVSERQMAGRMIRSLPTRICYIVADSHYETNPLAQATREAGAQLTAPRPRTKRGKGLGNRRHDPARHRNIQMLESDRTPFTTELFNTRQVVERCFAQWSSSCGGLIGLPPWVRTYPRVKAWIQAHLVIALLRGTIPPPTRSVVA